jgi:bifunctional non-homologous end joining protein LigD
MCVVNDVDALTWVANQGTLELHPLLATAQRPDNPVELVFDLDPGPGAGLISCARIALAVRRLLSADGLVAWVKTSGSVGLHLVVPLDGKSTFADTRRYAREAAARLTAEFPALVTDVMTMAARVGRVLIDWRQNEPMRSMIAPYSLRATPWPLVATPLEWSEVETVAAGGDPRSIVFGPAAARRRFAELSDLWSDALTIRNSMPAVGGGPTRRMRA